MQNFTLLSTAKKYESMVDVVVPQLIDLLSKLTEVEEKYSAELERLESEKESLGIPENEEHPDYDDMWAEFENSYTAVLEGHCTDKILSGFSKCSISSPAPYAFLRGEYTGEFTMRKGDMATVIFHYTYGTSDKLKFILRLRDDKWLVDEVFSGFEDEKTWYSSGI